MAANKPKTPPVDLTAIAVPHGSTRGKQKRGTDEDIDDVIYELRINGRKTFRAIGQEIGMSGNGVWKRWTKHISKPVSDEEWNARREEENLKLDHMDEVLHAMIGAHIDARSNPDKILDCIDRSIRVHQSRVRLNGLNPPERKEISVTTDTLAAKLEAFVLDEEEDE